ncbi:hypothetical protein ACQY0O_004864 [Thecaphora frezii]
MWDTLSRPAQQLEGGSSGSTSPKMGDFAYGHVAMYSDNAAAGLTLFLWEFASTLPDEIFLYRTLRHRSPQVLLFALVRYAGLFAISLTAYAAWSSSDRKPCLPYAGISMMLVQVPKVMIFSWRTIAIWRRDRRITFLMLALSLWLVLQGFAALLVPGHRRRDGICTADREMLKAMVVVLLLAMIIFDTVVIVLTVSKLWLYHRLGMSEVNSGAATPLYRTSVSLDVYSCHLGLGGLRNWMRTGIDRAKQHRDQAVPLILKLAGNGLLYFAIITTATLITLLFTVARTPALPEMMTPLLVSMMCVVCQRILLLEIRAVWNLENNVRDGFLSVGTEVVDPRLRQTLRNIVCVPPSPDAHGLQTYPEDGSSLAGAAAAREGGDCFALGTLRTAASNERREGSAFGDEAVRTPHATGADAGHSGRFLSPTPLHRTLPPVNAPRRGARVATSSVNVSSSSRRLLSYSVDAEPRSDMEEVEWIGAEVKSRSTGWSGSMCTLFSTTRTSTPSSSDSRGPDAVAWSTVGARKACSDQTLREALGPITGCSKTKPTPTGRGARQLVSPDRERQQSLDEQCSSSAEAHRHKGLSLPKRLGRVRLLSLDRFHHQQQQQPPMPLRIATDMPRAGSEADKPSPPPPSEDPAAYWTTIQQISEPTRSWVRPQTMRELVGLMSEEERTLAVRMAGLDTAPFCQQDSPYGF